MKAGLSCSLIYNSLDTAFFAPVGVLPRQTRSAPSKSLKMGICASFVFFCMNIKKINTFKKIIRDYYSENKRILPWRNIEDPYKVFVSEIMLQQTQVTRVLKKYPEFLNAFPDFTSLSAASTTSLLTAWQGMGYNRRALYMRSAAKIIVEKFNGILPKDPEILITMPGVGAATAGSLAVFSYNIPTVFIETNIRRVFIHHFFPDRKNVSDKELSPLVNSSLDQRNPRDWYYALMDYGVMLSKQFGNANKRSRHYAVQSKFEGSNRQLRGAIIRRLTQTPSCSVSEITDYTARDASLVKKILNQLAAEGFILEDKGVYTIRNTSV